MNRFFLRLAVVVGVVQLVAPTASLAARAPAPPVSLREERAILVPFDPPLGEPLHYRVEEVVDQGGDVTRSSSTYAFEFEERPGGFRLVVTPLAISSDPLDRDGEIGRQMTALTQRPFALAVNEQGEIVEMEDEEAYWDAIMALVESGAMEVSDTAARREMARRVVQTIGELPNETRLALLTQEIQPLLTFVSAEMVIGERRAAPIEIPWLLGGTVTTQAYTTLERVEDGRAMVSSHVSVPREALEQVTRDLFERFRPQDGRNAADEAARLLSRFDRLSRETTENYVVSLTSGLTERYRSTETVEVGSARTHNRAVTVRTLQRIG
jgi:hypothetical protein